MDYIFQEVDLLVQNLKHQRENYTYHFKKSPPGGLIRIFKRKQEVYMHSIPDGRYPNGSPKYVKKTLTEDSTLLRQLVLKEYLRIALKLLDHNIHCLELALKSLRPQNFKAVRKRMRNPYQAVSDKLLEMAFLEGASISGEGTRLRQHEWAAKPFDQSTYKPEEKNHFTSRGLAVRSRAELAIAEKLYEYDIPFRYEQVIQIGRYEFAPDFTFLDTNGEEFYWEYCGMMSSPTYLDHQLWRRHMYEEIGINEWTNMIYTYDASDSIDMREIEAIIKTKILPRIQGR